jgi:hypothetical protein
LLQVEIQVWTRAKLKDGTKAIMVNFNSVVLFHNSPMIEIFVNFVLTYGMLYVIVLDLLRPTVVKVVNFASNFSAVFEIEGFVDF